MARALINKYGNTATLERTSAEDPGRTIKVVADEKPTHLPWRFKEDVRGLGDTDMVPFLVAVPSPLPDGYMTALDWAEDWVPRNARFTVGGITYTIMRRIPVEAQDVLIAFQLVCNT
jgi:hypothetical protein